MKRVLGLVVALPAEARFLTGYGHWKRAGGRIFRSSRLPEGTDLLCVRSGMGIQNALSAARWLVSEGVAALAVLGVSGGLDPGLNSGDLIVGEKVLEESVRGSDCVWEGSPKLVGSAHAALKGGGLPTHTGTVITMNRPVLSTERKESIYRKTLALAVDMESSAVARTATEAGLPFFLLRAICDTFDRSIPGDLFLCLDETGRVRFRLLLHKLWRNPSLVAELLRTRSLFVTALKGLRWGWQLQITNDLPTLLISGG